MNNVDKFPRYFYNPFTHELRQVHDEIQLSPELLKKYPKWQWHHFLEKKFLKKQKNKEELLKHQKMILMPEDMNQAIERRVANFEKKWGIELEKVVYISE